MKNNTRKILIALLVVMTLLVGLTTLTVSAAEDAPEVSDGNITIYFENNWLWTDVRCHYWGSASSPDTEFPGVEMTNVGTMSGHEVYSLSIPADVTGLIINGIKDDGSGNRDQTPDIVEGIFEGAGWKMLWADGNMVESISYDPNAPVEPTPTPDPSGITYTVAGVGGLCFSEWDVADSYNDMIFNEETGLYEKTFKGIPAGDYECKVAANHSWDQSWGGESGEFGNYGFTTYDEHDITITFDPVEQKVGHVLADSTGPDEDRPTPEAPDIDTTDTITVYLADSAGWNTVYYYCWTLGSADQNASWPGVEMQWDDEKLLYYAEVPTYYVNIIFNNGSGVQTADLAVGGDGAIFDNVSNQWTDLGNYVPPIPPEDTTEDITVYVKDDAGWADVYIYYWNVAGIEACTFPGIPMELGDDGYYYATIPAGFCSVIFSNGGSWEDGSLKQTPDLRIPTDGKVYLSNGSDCLYNEGTADDNDAWYSVGGSTGDNDNDEGGNTEQPDNNQPGDSDGQPDEPKQPTKMTFIQKVAKAILLFLRKIQDFFKGIFKK